MIAIVAVGENWGIGKNNDLLFSLPSDMKFFRETTLGKVVIMGDRTYMSLPFRPLKRRTNIVMTLDKNFKAEGATVVHSVDELLKEAQRFSKDDVYVCGGGAIYRLLLPYCESALVTKVECAKEADTFFPNLDELAGWKLVEKGERLEENCLKFSFCRYENINKN